VIAPQTAYQQTEIKCASGYVPHRRKGSMGCIEANTIHLVQSIYERQRANLYWKCQTTVLDPETEIPRGGGREISGIREAIQACLWKSPQAPETHLWQETGKQEKYDGQIKLLTPQSLTPVIVVCRAKSR
jgi:hypothetical protein